MTVQCRTIACSGNGDHTILYDPAVVEALPFKYRESIESVASALNCAETALC
jgi:hypothetical protein